MSESTGKEAEEKEIVTRGFRNVLPSLFISSTHSGKVDNHGGSRCSQWAMLFGNRPLFGLPLHSLHSQSLNLSHAFMSCLLGEP